MYQAQSYYSTIMRGSVSTYEMRIMLHIVKRCKLITKAEGITYKDLVSRRVSADGLSCRFAIPVRDIIGKSHNYAVIKSAVRKMRNWSVEYYDKDARVWKLGGVVENVELDEQVAVLKFSTPRWILDYIVNFGNGGYRQYDFETAMSMRNVYASRLYTICCSMSTPIVYDLGSFKLMLGVDDKYKKVSDLVRRVLKPAQAEMNRLGCNSFDYEIIRKYKTVPTSTPVAIKIRPVKREKAGAENVGQAVKEIAASGVPKLLLDYLSINLHFSSREIAGSVKTLSAFCRREDWQEKFFEISERMRRKRKNHGYIINALKSELQK